MKQKLLSTIISASTVASLLLAGNSYAAQDPAQVAAVKQLAAKSSIVQAIEAANKSRADVRGKALKSLNLTWREEAKAKSGKMINSVTDSALAKELKSDVTASNGKYAGIIVMDNRGLSVASTYISRDYNQSTKAMWRHIHRAGPHAVYVSKLRKDRTLNKRVTTVSVPVMQNNHRIGAVAVKFNGPSPVKKGGVIEL